MERSSTILSLSIYLSLLPTRELFEPDGQDGNCSFLKQNNNNHANKIAQNCPALEATCLEQLEQTGHFGTAPFSKNLALTFFTIKPMLLHF
jgi:hypothetical protein